MAKDNKDKNPIKDKDISALDKLAQRLLSTIDSSYNEKSILSEKSSKIQKILDSELQLSNGVSNNSIVDFIAHISKSSDNNKSNKYTNNDFSEEIFNSDMGNLFEYFQDQYKNRYLELSDLKFVSKFIPSLGEAVKVTLEGVVGADDYSTSVNRSIDYGTGLTEIELDQATKELVRIEKELKLLRNLKNVTYNRALIGGIDYIYAIGYEELFNEYESLKAKGKFKDNPLGAKPMYSTKNNGKNNSSPHGFNVNANESTEYGFDDSLYISPSIDKDAFFSALESSDIFDELDSKIKDKTIKEIKKKYDANDEFIPNYTICDSDFLVEAIEGVSNLSTSSAYLDKYDDMFGRVNISNIGGEVSYGVDGQSTNKPRNPRAVKYKAKGTYIKFIDANHLVPIQIFDEIIGYFYIHDTTVNKKTIRDRNNSSNSLMTVSNNIFNSNQLTEKKKDSALKVISDTVSNSIIQNFSNKFVNNNPQFKKLIADCIIANGMMNTNFQIQFIPAKYIIPFAINMDETGRGRSILQDSLFPAKLQLSLVVSKLLLYMNKAGNKTIAHIKKGPINIQGANQVQRAIRMMQESQITFPDLLSTNATFAKFNRDGNMQFPQSRSGDKLIEFEIQEGQHVDMKTDMEEWLDKNTVMGTGVPSVIMEYTDAADYSKSITTGQIKFAGRIASLQSDLEEPTTDLYKILIKNSSLEDNLKMKLINNIRFRLPRPKVLSSQNMVDFLQNIQQGATLQSDILMGTSDADKDPNNGKIKDNLMRQIVIANSPFIDWSALHDMYERAKLEAIKDEDFNKDDSDLDNNIDEE